MSDLFVRVQGLGASDSGVRETPAPESPGLFCSGLLLLGRAGYLSVARI